jgi:OOP family OmpA-OmpF porin
MKLQFSAALIAAALALPVAAQTQAQSYIGASVGSSAQKYSADGSSDTVNETAYKLFAGYNFTKNYGLEAGYADFGDADSSGDGVSATLKPSSVYIAATATYPVAPQLFVTGKLGVANNHTKAELSYDGDTYSGSENKTTGMIGIGMAYQFTKNVSGTVDYEYFGKALSDNGADLKLSMFTVGLRYAF